MKRLSAIATLIIAFLLSGTSMAHAATFFDVSQGWWMAESQWQKYTEGGMDIKEAGNTLGVSNPDTSNNAYAEYSSLWNLNMDNDAAMSVNFYFNPSGTQKNTGLKLGLVPSGNTVLDGVTIGRGDNATGAPGYFWELDLGSGYSQDSQSGSNNSGIFTIDYLAATKKMTLSTTEGGINKVQDLTGLIGPGQLMSVYLAGGSENTDYEPFSYDSVYFSNFQLTKGTALGSGSVIPEPASLSLLGLGLLGVLGIRRKKR